MDEPRLGLHESIDFAVEYFIASTPTQDQYNNQLIATNEIYRNAHAYLLVSYKLSMYLYNFIFCRIIFSSL